MKKRRNNRLVYMLDEKVNHSHGWWILPFLLLFMDYQNCKLDITIKNNQWEKRSGEYRIVTTVVVNVLLPENYDGFVIGVRNSDVNYYESDYLYQYYDADNFVMHRMGVGQ